MVSLQVWSMRGEFGKDLDQFEVAMGNANFNVIDPVRVLNYDIDANGQKSKFPYPEEDFEFKTDATEEQMLVLLEKQADSHLMIRTMRPVPLAENSLESDYTRD